MHERPDFVDDATVLAAVREWWNVDVDAITHLPVGFGAHHWCASMRGEPRLFVTLEGLGFRHDLASLAQTYAATAALGFDFGNANLEPWVVPLAEHALSVTPWLDGARPANLDIAATTAMLDSLHTATPPPGLRRWAPLVGSDLADRLTDAVTRPWTSGPLGEQARAAIAERLENIGGWVAQYHRLADVARSRPWVATHGEPGIHNQLLTSNGLRLIDWQTLMLTPAERDLRTVGLGNDTMVDMFELEWRLDEINIGATWLQAPTTERPMTAKPSRTSERNSACHVGPRPRHDALQQGMETQQVGMVEEPDRRDAQKPNPGRTRVSRAEAHNALSGHPIPSAERPRLATRHKHKCTACGITEAIPHGSA